MRFKFILLVSMLFVPFIIDAVEAQSFSTGGIGIITSNYGRVRVHSDSVAGLRQIDRSSFLAAVDTDFVFSYWLSTGIVDTFKNVDDPAISDYEIYGSVDNTGDATEGSPDFLVKHNVYGWNGGAYTLVKFTVINREASAQNTALGMEIISQLDGSYGLETLYWMPENEIVSQYRPPASTYVGYKLVSGQTTNARFIDWYDGYNLGNADLYHWMTGAQIDAPFESGGDGAVGFFAQDPVSIAAGDSVEMWVAISLGVDEAAMVANMNLAEARFNSITDVKEETITSVPSEYRLLQNYPNPFNPSTEIQFSLPENGFVTLKIYDVLGNEITTLVNKELNPGIHNVTFESRALPSGTYFYQLVTGNYSETKKMNLLK